MDFSHTFKFHLMKLEFTFSFHNRNYIYQLQKIVVKDFSLTTIFLIILFFFIFFNSFTYFMISSYFITLPLQLEAQHKLHLLLQVLLVVNNVVFGINILHYIKLLCILIFFYLLLYQKQFFQIPHYFLILLFQMLHYLLSML